MISKAARGAAIGLAGLSFVIGVCATRAAVDMHWQLGPFIRPAEGNPIIRADRGSVFKDPILGASVHWEALHTFNPAAIVRGDKVFVLYRAEDDSGSMAIGMHTSRLGLAESADGMHFTRRGEPVFYAAPDEQKDREWPGGVEDPRIVESEDGTYVITYTQWNRKTYSIGIATSRDLITWQKRGPAFGSAPGEKYSSLQYKSGAIVTALKNGRLIAARIQGKYWMYWGEGTVRVATSPDLIHWQPVEDAGGNAVAVLGPRRGHFDSHFPETGAPAVLTETGIVLLYNGKNAADETRDTSLEPNAYAAGQALFSASDPAKLLDRTDQPFFKPEMPFERSGQYAAGTTFVEGLVQFHGRWMLYYGCADSLVGVALSGLPSTK
jgi:beta-1,2-mannosidase